MSLNQLLHTKKTCVFKTYDDFWILVDAGRVSAVEMMEWSFVYNLLVFSLCQNVKAVGLIVELLQQPD